jgi:RAD51-like protein 3
MRLTALVPSIPENVVTSLERCGIKTDADLLFSAPVFDIFRSLPPGTVTLCDLKRYVDAVAEKVSAPGVSAERLLDLEIQAQENDSSLQSGVPELDHLLGGFGGRRVIEISGEKQSGKTVSSFGMILCAAADRESCQALALHVVLRHLAHHGQSHISWIDTSGDFSVDRAIQLLDSYDTQVTRGISVIAIQLNLCNLH